MHFLRGIILAQDGLGGFVRGSVAKVEKTIWVRLYRHFPETPIRKVDALRPSFTPLFNKTPVEEERGGKNSRPVFSFYPGGKVPDIEAITEKVTSL